MSDNESSFQDSELESDSWESTDNIIGDNSESSDQSEEDFTEFESQFEPYNEEPIAPPDYELNTEENDDPDGLSSQVLADREKGVIAVEEW